MAAAHLQPPRPTPYGHCSTFFVENDTDADGIFARRYEARKRYEAAHQAHSRRVQEQIKEDLTLATADEYQEDIVRHMERMEAETLPDVNSIDIQTEIQWYMRPYLVDFLIEAHAAFGLLEETLFLAVNLLDRYCSKRVVYKRHYQLVGCAALLIAAKYGDRKDRVPTVRELKSMCCSLYEEEMFTQMEWHVLVTLDWVIGHPTVDSFLQLGLSEDPEELEIEHLSWFACEMALYRREFVSTPPSILARCALTLAKYILDRLHPTDADAELLSHPVFIQLAHLVQGEKSQVLTKKYSSPQYSSSCQTLELFLMRQAEAQRQAALTPQHDPFRDPHAVPHTPQKMLGDQGSTYGYMTPPITPETMGPTGMMAAKAIPAHVHQMCSNLTPPPTGQHGDMAAHWPQPPSQMPYLPSQHQPQHGLYAP